MNHSDSSSNISYYHSGLLEAHTDSNVVSLEQFRRLKRITDQDLDYARLIEKMTKLELLDEMIRFQEERTRVGQLTYKMMIRGRHLFDALERNAETREMRLLARSYKRHLEHELLAQKETK
jgi:hypothetical protein